VLVVVVAKFGERVTKFIQIPESADPKQLFFNRSEESLDTTVAFQLPDKGR
jgi:hypothetical protein